MSEQGDVMDIMAFNVAQMTSVDTADRQSESLMVITMKDGNIYNCTLQLAND